MLVLGYTNNAEFVKALSDKLLQNLYKVKYFYLFLRTYNFNDQCLIFCYLKGLNFLKLFVVILNNEQKVDLDLIKLDLEANLKGLISRIEQSETDFTEYLGLLYFYSNQQIIKTF
jgi:hypothetical protein